MLKQKSINTRGEQNEKQSNRTEKNLNEVLLYWQTKKEIVREIGKLSPAQAEHVLQIIRDLNGRENR
ncbi:MAG: hypothetical protein ACOYJ5_10235 [Acutalibacteraceae bacterium]